MKSVAAYISIVLVVSGCSMFGSKPAVVTPTNDYQRYNQIDRETKMLLSRISDSLIILAETRQGAMILESTPAEMREREWLFQVTPPGMGVPMTVNNWRGHPSVVLRMIAASTGYSIENIGTPSSDVRNVSASYISRPAVDILRSVSTQMGCDARVDVQSANRKLVVDWSIRMRSGCS
jgi:hypothetical protein